MLSLGLMSGTSMDGIDAALLETDGEQQIHECGAVKLNYTTETRCLFKAAERAFKLAQGRAAQADASYLQALHDYFKHELQLVMPHLLQDEVLRLTDYLNQQLGLTGALTLAKVTQHSTRLHADAVHQLLAQTGKMKADIDVIGYHGQTLYHQPAAKITVQMGDGRLLAQLTGIKVVNEFRQRDVSEGGQGAPFAPLYHQALAHVGNKLPLVVVNCGSIANMSVIPSACMDDLVGFDTGPGNGLIDALIKQRTHGRECMDENGQYGRQGRVDDFVLQALHARALPFKDNFFDKKPPKSLDIRDMVLIPELQWMALTDACKTLEVFTAKTVVDSLELLDTPLHAIPRHWILAGGGWYNPVIRSELELRLKQKLACEIKVQTATEAGWNSDAMEAQLFAYLAVRSLKNLPLSVPGTTGVPIPLCGGYVYG